MNRQERRRLERKGINPAEYQKLKEKVVREYSQYIYRNYSAAALLVLRNEFGFGKMRAQKFLGHVEDYFDDLNNERISYAEVVATIEEKLEIKFGGDGRGQ